MADLLNAAATWLASVMGASAAATVTYTAAAGSVSVAATVGRTAARQTDQAGRTKLVFSDRDYLIAAADLVINGAPHEPAAGDKIVHAGVTYVVAGIGFEPHARASDPYGVRWRIHTKKG